MSMQSWKKIDQKLLIFGSGNEALTDGRTLNSSEANRGIKLKLYRIVYNISLYKLLLFIAIA